MIFQHFECNVFIQWIYNSFDMYEVNPAIIQFSANPTKQAMSKSKPQLLETARQAFQKADKHASLNTKAHVPQLSEMNENMNSDNIPISTKARKYISELVPWGDDEDDNVPIESFTADSDTVSESSEDPELNIRTSNIKNVPRPTNAWSAFPIPQETHVPATPTKPHVQNDPVPAQNSAQPNTFPRMAIPYQSARASTVRAMYDSPPSDMISQIARLEAQIAELQRQQTFDVRSSYTLEELGICLGLGVGIIYLLNKIKK